MMKAALKILISLLTLSLAQALACAQIPEGAEREFEVAVDQYTVNYRNLMNTRGVSAGRTERRRRVPQHETLREITDAFLLRGAPPLSEYVGDSSLDDITAALRNNFPQGTALIFYAYKGETLQIWLVNQTGLQAYASDFIPQQKLESAIYDLRIALGVDSLQASRAPALLNDVPAPPRTIEPARAKLSAEQAIAQVTTILLPPVVAKHMDSVRHLIVAPILGLGTVPYAVLRPFKSDAFLIDKMSVSVVPSLFDVEGRTREWTPSYQKPLIIGNPYLPPSRRWRVPPLPGAQDEAQSIAGLVNARPLTGRQATRRKVIARASRADFLYFATHGVASSDDPLSGGFLFLSARTLAGGFWTAREVQNSRLNAQIAILSACQTGLGRVHDAGVIGLSRAFQIAGVPRVVMSLWSVNDRATADLMKAFVKYLRTHIPSESLRLAMLDVRRQRPAPSQWASFVLFGTPR
jgi:CHAT domain-containing protein